MKTLSQFLLGILLMLPLYSSSYGFVSLTPPPQRPGAQPQQNHELPAFTSSTHIVSFHGRRIINNQYHIISSKTNMQQHNYPPTFLCSTASSDDDDDSSTSTGIDLSFDRRLYKVRLSRATGIDWGTDLSFSFVYVRAMDPSGAAALSDMISINDQLCEVTPCSSSKTSDDAATSNDDSTAPAVQQPINLIGAPFDYVMETFATLDRNVKELDFVFFRGSRDELKSICTGSTNLAGEGSDMITVTVVENKGSSTEMIRQLRAPVGVNVRELLVNNNINVYQSITRWTNCKGKQLCGTCIVNIPTGGRYTNRKSMDEASTLRENPDSYRLSCVSFAYGDITVETFPPINAAQWTR